MRFAPSALAILATLSSLATSACAEPPLTVSTDFAGGSARVLKIDSQVRTIRIAPGGQPSRGWVCWWSLKIENAEPGQPLVLEVTPSDVPTRHKGEQTEKPLAPGWSLPARAHVSNDGHTWHPSAPGVRTGNLVRYEVTPVGKTIWLAWGPPFTPSDTAELIAAAAAKITTARPFELTRSREGRPIMALRIGNGTPKPGAKEPGVWIQARQHAWESGSSWVARGLVEWLAGDDKSAQWLKEHAETVIVPIMDVDNAATGNGGKEEDPWDHNRDWDDRPVFPEVAAAQEQLKHWATEDRLDFFIDLHNPAPNDLRPFFFAGPPEFLRDLSRNNRALFLEIAQKHITDPLAVEANPRLTGPSYHPLWRKISGQWVTDHGNNHTVAVCLETPWNTPHSTVAGYTSVGRQLGQAIAEYLQRRKR